MQIEDKYIIQKCLNGETEAFGFLVDRYRQSVYAFAYSKLRNRQDAEDVTQKVFIKAYQKLRTLKQWDNMHAWLYSITANMCKDWIRVQSRRPDRSFIEDQDPKKIDSLSTDSQDNDPMIESLNEALESLPEIYRQVLTLYYLGDRDSKEIANFLGISPTSVRQRLARARDLLKEEMIAMMSKTYEAQRLPLGFTFRVVESIRRIKIDSISIGKGVPWGLSLATGLLIAVIGLNPHFMKIMQTDTFANPALSGESSVLETGDFPVDIAKISQKPFIANQEGANAGKSSDNTLMQNAIFMAPQAEGGTWTKKADMPTARYNSASAVVKDKIYVIGGVNWNSSPALLTVEEYDPSTDKWTEKADIPTRRVGAGAEAVNDKIYVISGGEAFQNLVSAVEEYNPMTDTWSKKGDIPTARRWFGCAAVNGKIYAMGGDDSLGIEVDNGGHAVKTVEEYDPMTDIWTKKTDMPVAVYMACTLALNDKIYVFGGADRKEVGVCKQFKTVQEYDSLTDKWALKSDMPEPRSVSGGGVSNGKAIIIGGDVANNTFDFSHQTVIEYDPVEDMWSAKTDMQAEIRDLWCVNAVNSKIYIIGGCTVNRLVPNVDEYDPGITSKNVNFKGKLPTKWGEIKR